MATVVKTALVNATISDAWRAISDVSNASALTGMITQSTMDGDHRHCVLADGSELKETILSVDHDLKRMAYRVHVSPFPIEEHAASIVVDVIDGQTRLTWTTDFKPDSAKDAFEGAADMMFADVVARMNDMTADA